MITQVHRLPGLVLSDMEFSVPLDYAAPAAERITVFARAVVAPGKEEANLPSVMFTGEMVYPWIFEEYEQLRPLREAANILAEYHDWPRLYDVAALQANRVPCAAAVYYNDMYVSRIYSEETTATIRGLKVWVTSEYEHNGLRADGEHILGRLLDMVRGKI